MIELTKPVCSLEIPDFDLLTQFNIPQKSHHFNRRGESCLHIAIKRGYLELVKYLLETKYKADINQPTEAEKYTPLHLAVINNDPSITAYLLCQPDIDFFAVDKQGLTPYDYALSPLRSVFHDPETYAPIIQIAQVYNNYNINDFQRRYDDISIGRKMHKNCYFSIVNLKKENERTTTEHTTANTHQITISSTNEI